MGLSLFLRFVLYKFKSQMEYRGAFLIGIWGQGLGYVADFVVLWLLVQKFQTINGWNWSEIALLVSLNVFTYALGASFFYHMTGFDSLVISGGFDRYLTSPLHPLTHLSANQFNIGYIAHFIVAGSFLIWSLVQLETDWSIATIFFLGVVLVSGGLMHAAAFIFLGSWAFIFTRSQFLFTLYGALRDFISYPISIYGFFVQTLLTFGIPFAFINYYPSIVILSKDGGIFPTWLGLIAPLVAVACFLLSLLMWFYGIKRYQSAGG
ncbi:ABC transporter permease [Paenibacillus sp. SAFN-117]|uniref:ABC transporter permease n=1 Tax=Paenibacillus sp. SAFN-117 TaxID=3436860 RepID=UPI003F7F8078